MNFTRWDMGIIFASVMAVVLMSFIMPAMGQTSADNVNQSDIPEFNITHEEWEIVGSFPSDPGKATTGTLERYENRTLLGEHIAWLDRPKADGFSIELTNFSGDMKININNWSGGDSVAKDLYNITGEGQQIRHNNESWSLEFTVQKFANHNTSDMVAVVDWEILESPQDDEGGGIENIPIIGWIWGAGEYLASIIYYLGSIMYWLVGSAIETGIALVGILVSILQFGFDTMIFLTTTYSEIIDQASDWAVVIVTIPLLLLWLEMAKIAMIGVSLLPYT